MGKYHNGEYHAINTAAAYKRYLRAILKGTNQTRTSEWIRLNLREIQPVNHFKVDIPTEEILKLIAVTEQPELKYAWSIMAFDGFRPGETLGHYHTDIDTTTKTILLQRHEGEKYFPKGMKLGEPAISIPINEFSLLLYQQVPKEDNRVVNISYKTMRKWFNRYVKLAELKDRNGNKITAHKLRHFFGHYYNNNKGNIVTLKEIMRHSDLRYTMIYTAPSKREVTEDFNKTVNQTLKTTT